MSEGTESCWYKGNGKSCCRENLTICTKLVNEVNRNEK